MRSSGGVFDVDRLRARLAALEREVARPDLWDSREQAERTLREKSAVEREVAMFDRLAGSLEEAGVLLELAVEHDVGELARVLQRHAPDLGAIGQPVQWGATAC